MDMRLFFCLVVNNIFFPNRPKSINDVLELVIASGLASEGNYKANREK